MEMATVIRKPVVAGTFYPGDPGRLEKEIRSYLERVTVDRTAEYIVALVAPHAGYVYSGPVAAYSYRQLQGKAYDTVVVISPSHRDLFNFSSVFQGKGYETPLGSIEVDQKTAGELASHIERSVRISSEGHLYSGEHSLEVQLPFLQVVLGSFKLVPIVMGSQDRENCLSLGRALTDVLARKKALIVASSDLSHYHSQKTAQAMDSGVVESINRFDPDGLLGMISGHKSEACGAGPVAAAMYAAKGLGAKHGENLYYATSGDVSGDYGQVVGYTAGIFYH
ncbi:MAG TPA: AmmeMemoRadiSam system protein B [archaeon]|nr:AmmeMemoRadiSam system protein B [archaeon]